MIMNENNTIALMQKTKSDVVFDILKEDILRGRLLPGQKLGMAEVAERFKVKVPPVREALKRLEGEGLVENVPYVGIFVSKLTVEDMEKAFEIRIELEALAAKLATEFATPEFINELELLVNKMDHALGEGSPDYVKLNREFHMMIAEGSKNEHLVSFVEKVWDLSQRAQIIFRVDGSRPHCSNKEHWEIVKAIKLGDAVKAAQLTKEHKTITLGILKNIAKNLK